MSRRVSSRWRSRGPGVGPSRTRFSQEPTGNDRRTLVARTSRGYSHINGHPWAGQRILVPSQSPCRYRLLFVRRAFTGPWAERRGIESHPGLQKARRPPQNATAVPEELMDILVIDDEVSLRRTLRTALESMGHAVAEAASRDQCASCRGNNSTWPSSTSASAGKPASTCSTNCSGRHPAWPWSSPPPSPVSDRPSRRCGAARSTISPSRSRPISSAS